MSISEPRSIVQPPFIVRNSALVTVCTMAVVAVALSSLVGPAYMRNITDICIADGGDLFSCADEAVMPTFAVIMFAAMGLSFGLNSFCLYVLNRQLSYNSNCKDSGLAKATRHSAQQALGSFILMIVTLILIIAGHIASPGHRFGDDSQDGTSTPTTITVCLGHQIYDPASGHCVSDGGLMNT